MNYENSWTQPGEGFLKEVELDEEVKFSVPTKDGKNIFQVIDRDTKGMRGSHPSLDGAKKFAKNKGIIK